MVGVVRFSPTTQVLAAGSRVEEERETRGQHPPDEWMRTTDGSRREVTGLRDA